MTDPVRHRLLLLGEPALLLDRSPVAAPIHRKQWALLAFLHLEGERSHARENLAAMFWPALDAAAARNNLRQTLHQLRNALGADCLIAGREAVRLRAESIASDAADFLAATDAEDIEAMERAARLWRGEFLAGLEIGEAPEFEAWRAAHHEALHRRMFALVERLRDGRERLGDLDRALVHARRAAELEPWDEAAQRALMRLLAAAGRRTEALEVFETCRELLRRELDVEPEADTLALAESLRAGGALPAPRFAERRLATVLCCVFDLPGEDDPETVAAALAVPLARCTDIVRRQGGHVVAGDPGTLTAWFGYPVATEDAARRAVRAALSLPAASSPAAAHVGLAVDTIVAGGDADRPDAAGLALKRARRLADAAAAGAPLAGASLARLVAGYFHMEALPAGSGPHACRVLGETGASCRLDAAATLLPLVGRTSELARLSALWDETWRGKGRRLVLSGEAGIGKSRLLRALRESLAEVSWSIRELHCREEWREMPLKATTALIERLLAFGPNDTPQERHDLLRAYLAAYHAPFCDSAYPLIEALLGIGAGPPALPPERLVREAVAVLLELFGDAARRQPLLLVVEDLHWADEATLELLGLAATHGADLPVLSIYTTRPERPLPDWLAGAERLELAPLDAAAMTTLVEEAEAGLADDTVRAIVARAEGVPLIGEELARCAAETGIAGIPSTLDALFAARLDAAGPARRLAQLAATLGREFDTELLRHLAAPEADAFAAHLRALEAARLVVPAGGDRYRFRHALLRDAAYASLTQADRRATHLRVAEILRAHFPQRLRLDPGEAARHLAAAGRRSKRVGAAGGSCGDVLRPP